MVLLLLRQRAVLDGTSYLATVLEETVYQNHRSITIVDIYVIQQYICRQDRRDKIQDTHSLSRE